MEYGTSGTEIIPSTQGYEPSVPGLQLVPAHRLTVLPQQGRDDPQGVVEGYGMSPRMQMNVVGCFQRMLGSHE
eukprot:12925974-Prorocentrum_lima.AAC.1